MKSICCILAGAFALVLGVFPLTGSAGVVEYSAQGNYLLSATYTGTASAAATRLPVGFSIRLGTFATGFNFAANSTNYTATNAAFTLFDTTTVGTGGGVGQFDRTTGNLDAIATTGQQLYFWVFNNVTPASATAWAIVSNNLWTVPAAGATGFAAYDTSDTGTFIPTGALGAIVTDTTAPSGLNLSVRLSPVPEPSTYVLSFLGLAGVVLLARHRRAAAV